MEDTRSVIRASDDAKELVGTAGWTALVKWVESLIRQDMDVIEKGARSWDEYQQAVGRIKSLRRVVERPGQLIENARKAMGDSYE